MLQIFIYYFMKVAVNFQFNHLPTYSIAYVYLYPLLLSLCINFRYTGLFKYI